MTEVRPQFRFSLRRALASMTLVAAGAAMWPLCMTLGPELSGGPLEEVFLLAVACAFFALPAAGMGLLFGRTYARYAAGVEIGLGALIWLCLPRIQ